jgi:aspartyl protease family protein
VTLSRSSDGHFRTEARVDGRRLELIVDTGASQIALRASDAARLGIHPTPRDYNVRVSTANGITRAALIQLQRVEVEDIVVRDVIAAK